METMDWLLHFSVLKMRKIDQCSNVLLNIKILTFDLEIGPHCTLLGHNALLQGVALL